MAVIFSFNLLAPYIFSCMYIIILSCNIPSQVELYPRQIQSGLNLFNHISTELCYIELISL